MEWKLRIISDLSEVRQQFVNTDGTQAVRPWVAFWKCSAAQALCIPNVSIKNGVLDDNDYIFTMLSALPDLIYTTALWGCYSYYIHFTDEEVEAGRVTWFAK